MATIKQAFKKRIWECAEKYKPTYQISYMENDGYDNELLLEKVDEVFDSFLASSVDDIRDYLDV